MLKIGDFSRLAQVSVKTLRYYAELGLLKPAWTDRFTGYRYYTVDQLPRLNRILALKDLGFSLEQVRQLLREDVAAVELRGMLRLKYSELQRQVQTEQERLARIEARLREIEHEGLTSSYAVVLKRVDRLSVVGIRTIVPEYGRVNELFEELRTYMQLHGAPLDGDCPYLTIYYDSEHHDRGADVEVAVPLMRLVAGTARVTIHDLPAAELMATVVHQGSRSTVHEAYGALGSWIESNGYRVAGPHREVYLQGAVVGKVPADCVVEVQFPVEKVVAKLSGQQKEKSMEPKIVTKPAFTIVGMRYQGLNKNNEIKAMWDQFLPRMNEVKNRINRETSYGLCSALENVPEGEFEYVSGVEVGTLSEIPEGMVARTAPAQKYAVFPCTLKTIGEAYAYAFQTWLPTSGYRPAGTPDFELYDADFDPESDDPILYVYIPIA